jgi:hypothetical protein
MVEDHRRNRSDEEEECTRTVQNPFGSETASMQTRLANRCSKPGARGDGQDRAWEMEPALPRRSARLPGGWTISACAEGEAYVSETTARSNTAIAKTPRNSRCSETKLRQPGARATDVLEPMAELRTSAGAVERTGSGVPEARPLAGPLGVTLPSKALTIGAFQIRPSSVANS